MIRTVDTAPNHTKFQLAGLAAYGWWHAALCYCGREMTDGVIPVRALPLVFPSATPDERLAAIEALVMEHAIHPVDKGERPKCHHPSWRCPRRVAREDSYVIHNYFRFQSRRSHAQKVREVRITVGRKGGEKSGEVRKQSASTPSNQRVEPLSDPIRTDPIRTEPRTKTTRVVLTDDQFIQALRESPAHKHLSIDGELGRMDTWLLAHPGRQKTRRFIVGWLNRQDKPLANGHSKRAVNDAWAGKTVAQEVKLK